MHRSGRSIPELALSRAPLHRRADLRADESHLPRLLADPATRVIRLIGDRVEVIEDDGGVRAVLGAPEARDRERLGVYLGEAGGTSYVGVVADDLVDEAGSAADDVVAADLRTLRQVGVVLDDIGTALFCTILALGNWHRTHAHCPRCGNRTDPALSGWTRRCEVDGSEHYPRTDMAVIMSVIDADDRLLLARGRGFRSAGMSVLAGFVEPGESLAGAVAREVAEEVGVRVTEVAYLDDQPWPFPASLMIGFTCRAQDTALRLQDDEIEAARWFTRDEIDAGLGDGSLVLPGRLSIARRLIEHWYGDTIDAPEIPLR